MILTHMSNRDRVVSLIETAEVVLFPWTEILVLTIRTLCNMIGA